MPHQRLIQADRRRGRTSETTTARRLLQQNEGALDTAGVYLLHFHPLHTPTEISQGKPAVATGIGSAM